MAQAPKPTGVMNKSELPSRFVFIDRFVFVFIVLSLFPASRPRAI